MRAAYRLSMIIALCAAALPAAAGEDAPLYFQATRNSATDYAGAWRLRFSGPLPVGAGVKLGVVATDRGEVTSMPVFVSASLGTLSDNSRKSRRGARLQLCPQTGNVEASISNIQPVWIGTAADMELRQSLDSVIDGQAQVNLAVSTNQQIYIADTRRRMSLTAGARLANNQDGVTATLKVERKLLDHWTVTADFAHGVETNTAQFSARYAFNW